MRSACITVAATIAIGCVAFATWSMVVSGRLTIDQMSSAAVLMSVVGVIPLWCLGWLLRDRFYPNSKDVVLPCVVALVASGASVLLYKMSPYTELTDWIDTLQAPLTVIAVMSIDLWLVIRSIQAHQVKDNEEAFLARYFE